MRENAPPLTWSSVFDVIALWRRELFKIFESHDFTTLEINPVVIDEAGQVCMLDLVSELDDTGTLSPRLLWAPVICGP